MAKKANGMLVASILPATSTEIIKPKFIYGSQAGYLIVIDCQNKKIYV